LTDLVAPCGRRNPAAKRRVTTMTKSRSFRSVRLGDAKRLTKGVGLGSIEANLQPGFPGI